MKWILAGLQKNVLYRGGGRGRREWGVVRNAKRKRRRGEQNQNDNNKIIIATIILAPWVLHLRRRV